MRKLSFLVMLCLCFACFYGCGSPENIPEGMQTGADGRNGVVLYVPRDWTYVESMGISYAFVGAGDTTGITLTYAETELDLDAYFEEEIHTLEASLDGFEKIKEVHNVKIDDQKTYMVEYTYQALDKTYHSESYVTRHMERGYVLTYREEKQENGLFSKTEERVAEILKHMSFTEKRSSLEYVEPQEDENAPDGMVLASNTKLCQYRLYIPQDWKIVKNTDTTLVVKSDTDRTSVNVFSTTSAYTTLDEHIAAYKKDLATLYQNLSFEEEQIVEIGNQYKVKKLEYTGDYNAVNYHVEQYIFNSGIYVYTITYTARGSAFIENHADFDQMLSAFRMGK